jgi:hypothetical protein
MLGSKNPKRYTRFWQRLLKVRSFSEWVIRTMRLTCLPIVNKEKERGSSLSLSSHCFMITVFYVLCANEPIVIKYHFLHPAYSHSNKHVLLFAFLYVFTFRSYILRGVICKWEEFSDYTICICIIFRLLSVLYAVSVSVYQYFPVGNCSRDFVIIILS